jgi:hypothetical protein
MNNEDKRADFNEEAYERGLKGEAYFNSLLKPYCKLHGLTYKWYNEKGESKKSFDFAIFRDNKIKSIVECETKGYIYEEYYKKDGVDFIYRKVHRDYPRGINCYYVMPIGSDEGYHYIIYLTMDDIKKYGEKKRKTTGRNRDKKESFMNVPFDKCNKWFYKGD